MSAALQSARKAARDPFILFSGPMVSAIRAGAKTETRRIVDLAELGPSTTPGYDWTWRGKAPVRSIAQQRRYPKGCWQDVRDDDLMRLCPYGGAGGRVWVRETWRADDYAPEETIYRADHLQAAEETRGIIRWNPSILMPRVRSRLTLRVEAVDVERLRAITDDGARREGVLTLPPRAGATTPRARFAALWSEINGPASWDRDPWVWVVRFTVLAGPEVSP